MKHRARAGNQTNMLGVIVLVAGMLLGILWSQGHTAQRQLTGPPLPIFSPFPGHYPAATVLTMTSPDPDLAIVYTMNGRVPTTEQANRYHHPILLESNTPSIVTIQAAVQYTDGQLGPPLTTSYFLGPLPELPIISLVLPPEDLFEMTQGIYANPEGRGLEWERPVHFTYLDESGHILADMAAGVRIHGNASRFDDKKSWRLYFRQEYGRNRLEAPLFPGSPVTSFKRLVLHAGGQETIEQAANWTLLRNALAYQLGREIGSVAPHSRPVLLTINGEFWGIYHLTERIDEHYFADQMGINEFDWLDTPELIFQQEEDSQSKQNWDQLMAFAASFDPHQPEDLAYIDSQIDLQNLIDYVVFQIYFGNNDWPRNNVLQFRPRTQGGKWQWVLWDFEYGFGHVRHSTTDLDMVAVALTKDHERVTGRFSMLLRKLLENEDFQDAFLTRMADLLNTTLEPTAVTQQIDTLAQPLAGAIQYESDRWAPLAETDWAAHVEEMRAFAQDRPHFVRQHLTDYFGRETHSLSIPLPPASEGTLLLNGIPISGTGQETVWQGLYFAGNKVRLTAAAAPGFELSSWGSSWPADEELLVEMETAVTLAPSFIPVQNE